MNEWMLVKKNVGIERTKAIHICMFRQRPTVTKERHNCAKKRESFCGEIDPAKRLRRKRAAVRVQLCHLHVSLSCLATTRDILFEAAFGCKFGSE